ncbi:MAG: tetratricopeptide repeat protein [Candidatus Melainabacteria bacterium]|nr:MAG: tetratricopeptide repeat protein [Candidatus Melainabacteria bacterium]
MAKAPISPPAAKIDLAKSLSLLLGLAFVSQLAPLHVMQPCRAADFSRAKKVFVPPTRIPRRFDAESASTEGDSYGDPGYTTPSSYKSGRISGKTGLVPPPPPLTPTLLPPSLLHMSAQTSGEGAAKPQRWSTSVQKTLKRASTSPKVASFLDQAQVKAQNLIKEGKLDQAQELLKSYVKSLPRDTALKNEFAKVSVQRAQQLLSDQNIDAAGRMAREALSVQPQNQAAHTVLAEVMKKQGMSAESAPDRLKTAHALLAKGKTSDAEMEFNAANRLKPSADAYVGLGDVAMKNNNKEKARLEYQKALELEPHSGAALRQMGIIRLGQSDIVGANSDLSRALVVNPNDKVASQHLIDLWQKQVTTNPHSANSHLGLARAHQLSGDLQSAQAEYRKVVEIDPNNANLPAARQSFKLALARQEAHHAVDAAHNLEAAGALQEAHAKVSEAVKLCPGDSSFKLYQAQLSEKMNAMAGAGTGGANGLVAAAAAAGGLAAAAPAMLLPGLTPQVAPAFRNTTVTAGQAFNGGVAEAPPAMSLPGIPKPAPLSTTTQVSSMSGFLTSLRNYSVQQKAQSQQMEDAAHAALKGLTEPATGSGPAPADMVAQSPVLASASSNLASVNSLLGSIGAKSLPGAGSGALTTSSQSAGSTASAAVAPKSVTETVAAAAVPDSTGALVAQAATSENLANLSAQARAALKTKKPVTKTGTIAKGKSLAEQNKLLQSQLQEAQKQLNALKSQPTLQAETPIASPVPYMSPTTGMASPQSIAPAIGMASSAPPTTGPYAPSFTSMQVPLSQLTAMMPQNAAGQLPSQASEASAQALSLTPNGASASMQTILQSLPASLTSSEGFQSALANLPNSAAALQSFAANLPPETQSALQAALKPPIPTNHSSSSGAVRLELEGVKPSPLDIKLNVVLHNDQKIALAVPSPANAVINMTGQPQRIVKINFPSKNVPPNGEIHGVIKVPGHNLSPSADLYIPNMLPGQGSERDLHLTVPISLK